MTPIPVADSLPATLQGTAYVLAYETGAGWVAATYHHECGWALDTNGISGWDWEAQDLGTVTHWMPYPPKPGGGA